MFLIPLNQVESVELVVHALRAAGGAADCTSCPAHRVCMKQCLTVAAAIERMIGEGTLPAVEAEETLEPDAAPQPPAEPGHLKVIK